MADSDGAKLAPKRLPLDESELKDFEKDGTVAVQAVTESLDKRVLVDEEVVANAKTSSEADSDKRVRVEEEGAEDDKHPTRPSTTTTTTNSTSGAQIQERSTVTFYCDDCNKARILDKQIADTFDLSEKWTCTMALPEGCTKTDDELVDIAGEMFAKVLDATGIKTRKQLAASDADEFDAGPWSAYIETWINEARDAEILDFVQDLYGDMDVIDLLAENDVVTLVDLVSADDTKLIDILSKMDDLDLKQLMDENEAVSAEDMLRGWRSRVTEFLSENPWAVPVE